MKSHALLLCALSILALPSYASNVYLNLNINYLSNVGDFDSEVSPGITLGYELNDYHALEFETQVNGFDRQEEGFDVDADLLTYLVNYRYTFNKSSDFLWYARIGGGISEPEFGLSASKRGEDSINVWHIGGGAEYALTDNLSLGVDLRYQDFGSIEDDNVSYEVGSPIVLGATIGYKF